MAPTPHFQRERRVEAKTGSFPASVAGGVMNEETMRKSCEPKRAVGDVVLLNQNHVSCACPVGRFLKHSVTVLRAVTVGNTAGAASGPAERVPPSVWTTKIAQGRKAS